MSAFEFVHPDKKEEVEKRSKEMLANGIAKPLVEQRRIRLDGQQVEVEVAVTPIDWDGERSIVVVSRDISARKTMERALRDSEDHLRT